jgi:hypothetical protein
VCLRSYASVHFLLVCFQGKHELWPYPADLPYIKGLLLAEVGRPGGALQAAALMSATCCMPYTVHPMHQLACMHGLVEC